MSVADLAALIRDCAPCVALTGAGVSTESGIPDFRSPEGIWARFDPFEYASIDAFRRDPAKVWEFYRLRLDVLGQAEPNAAHRALAELQRRGLLHAIVTQNVDGLHQRAGSKGVIEVHGSIRSASCPACGTRHPEAAVRLQLRQAPFPTCRRCGRALKPDVVMFGELLPADAMAQATELAREAGLLLVVGSSLEVYPVADLPRTTVEAGGRLAIVNRGPTAQDHRADLKLDGGAGVTLSAVVEALT